MRISDWSSDVCSSDLAAGAGDTVEGVSFGTPPGREGRDSMFPSRSASATCLRMAKPQKRYVCQSCGSVSHRWQGQCADCGEWNTLVEEAGAEIGRASCRERVCQEV